MKKNLRIKWQKNAKYLHQVFGFEFDPKEFKRAMSMAHSHPNSKPIFPLLMLGIGKKECIEIVEKEGIKIPESYRLGFNNNNCLKTGCIQGGIGYWQKMKREFPDKFDTMARMEHTLTDRKGSPVTMLKDQSASAKETGNTLVFLKKHPNYPNLKCIDEMKGREPEPLMECNGFCGMNDLLSNPKSLDELNFDILEDE